MKIGYARVSTDDQNLDLQLRALRRAGCKTIYEEKASGVLGERKALHQALKRCGKGDILVVWKLDRLGRSLLNMIDLIEELNLHGIGLRVLTGPGADIDTTRPEGRMIFGILATLAEFERELIRERTKAGMEAARKRGVHVGRPKILSEDDLKKARAMIDGGITKTATAATLGVTTITLRRALQKAEQPAFKTRKGSSPKGPKPIARKRGSVERKRAK